MASEDSFLAQGAEAKLYLGTFIGKPVVIKERFSKKYRHPDLDVKLTYERLAHEARCMLKARKAGVDAPVVYFVDMTNRRIFLERIFGITAKAFLCSPLISNASKRQLALRIGAGIACLHDVGMVHGDLTTSNIMIRGFHHPSGKDTVDAEDVPAVVAAGSSGAGADEAFPFSVVFIDFGLAEQKATVEDKGVDLYVLERAIVSGHTEEEAGGFFACILESYFARVNDSVAIRRKFEQVRTRGRKRLAFG